MASLHLTRRLARRAYSVTLVFMLTGCMGGAASDPNPDTYLREQGEVLSALRPAGQAPEAPATPSVQPRGCEGAEANGPGFYLGSILSFVAANTYHDEASLAEKRNSKFEAFLWPTITPSQVKSVMVYGPDDFTFEIHNAPMAEDLNGYVQNPRLPALWYQAILPTELRGGAYTLCMTYTNGEQHSYSRVLVVNDALLRFYLEHRAELTFRPNRGTSSAADTVLTWSTLRELGGPDAYYNAWISSGTHESIGLLNLRGDNIFVAALLDPRAGLNVGKSRLGSVFDPLPVGPLTWQVEILDSNRLDGVNQIIFPPGQNLVAK